MKNNENLEKGIFDEDKAVGVDTDYMWRQIEKKFPYLEGVDTFAWYGEGLPYVPCVEQFNNEYGDELIIMTPEHITEILKAFKENPEKTICLYKDLMTSFGKTFDISFVKERGITERFDNEENTAILDVYVVENEGILGQSDKEKMKKYEEYKKSILDLISDDKLTIQLPWTFIRQIINDDLMHDEDFISKINEMSKYSQTAEFLCDDLKNSKSREIVRSAKDIVDLEYGQNGYGLNCGPVRLQGKTKMATLFENYGRYHTQLCPTYGPDDEIPVFEIDIMNSDGEIIWSGMNNSQEFFDLADQVWPDCGIYYDSEVQKKMEKALGAEGEKLSLQTNPLVMVYSTALPPEVNKELLYSYFDTVEQLETVSETHIEDFISYHKRDLIECLGGKEQLVEFIKTMPGLEGIDELIKEVNEYTPSEIANGINPTQSEMDAVIAETIKGTVSPELDSKNKRPGDE